MNKKLIILAVLGFIIVAFVGYLYAMNDQEVTQVTMFNNKGEEIGTIRFNETKVGVLLGINVTGLTPNTEHAIHVHERGDCTPLDSFKNAGGHFNPENKNHGMKHPKGAHAGDMPNLKTNIKGESIAQIMNRRITLQDKVTEEGRQPIFDKDGSAFIIHAGADDHMSQPAGAAGARIACGSTKHEEERLKNLHKQPPPEPQGIE